MINISNMIIDPKELRLIKKNDYDHGSYVKHAIYIEFKNNDGDNILFADEQTRDKTFESLISALCIRSGLNDNTTKNE